jgi:hypothetical protein
MWREGGAHLRPRVSVVSATKSKHKNTKTVDTGRGDITGDV